MKTTTTVILLVVLFSSASLIAQKTSFGFTAGSTFSQQKAELENLSVTSDLKVGFTAGAFVDLPLNPVLSFQPALNFTQKGSSSKDGSSKDKLTLNYLELPLNVVLTPVKSIGFFVGAGPTMSYGLFGKDRYSYGSEKHTETVHFGTSDDDDLKPFEISMNMLAGYRFKKGWMLSGSYNLGLTNTGNFDANDYALKNNYFAFRVGWVLPDKTK